MTIRHATMDDMDRILQIIEIGRAYMASKGNPGQWKGEYPGRPQFSQDIQAGECYVLEEDGTVHAVFVLAMGEDPEYQRLDEGAWCNDLPYGTIHRLCSDGTQRGVFSQVLAFCRERIPNLRADTNINNTVMQHLLEKHGFCRCGSMHLKNGNVSFAYHLPWPEQPE